MRKGERGLFFAVLLVLVTALVLLVVQKVRGEDAPKIYRVSILLDGTDGNGWKNFRAGLNQAALERNVDLRFVTRYDGEADQTDVLRQEWEGEAEGVIIVPTDAGKLGETLREAPAGLAVCVVGPVLPTGRVDSYVSPDYDKMGRRLADAAAQVGAACTLFLSDDPSPAASLIAAGLAAGLQEKGIPFAQETVGESGLTEIPKEGALAAVESAVAEVLCAAPGGRERVCGVGVSDVLLRNLEEGAAAALVVQSDFDAGYLSLSRVVSRLSQEKAGNAVLESYAATRENMFEYPMSDILFSIY
ncbi:MAG TPA: substrate-binding domain-containing protein [Pseudoflavonifractor sp.]|nr:substrate-binding domain-containing protein [Pseudoflavonifractor sp.]